jgi:cation:H+ antiporter
MILWLLFVACTAMIVYSGTKLAKYGDIIAEKTGLGRTWIGVVLMASVTSLPELATGISSVTYAGVPDIAVGDIVGSCVFNMLILACLDALCRPVPICARAHQGHIISAGFGILLLSAVAMSLALQRYSPQLGWIGFYSLLFLILYFIAMRIVYTYEKKRIAGFVKEMALEMKYKGIPMKSALANYAINAVVVITAAMFLPKIGEGIAQATGLGQTFVGNILIAVSTSLPEVAVSIAAVRMDAIDLAIGNLFGSNLFNIFILFVDDLFYVKGPLLSFVNQNHLISALSAIGMATVAVIGLTYRAERKPLLLAWDSFSIILLYLVNVMLLYTMR